MANRDLMRVENDIISQVCDRLRPLLDNVPLAISDKPNAVYTRWDVANILANMCCARRSATATSNGLARESDIHPEYMPPRIMSGSHFIRLVSHIPAPRMESICCGLVNRTVGTLKDEDILKSGRDGLIAAIDTHSVMTYGTSNTDGYVTSTQPKDGSSKAYKFMSSVAVLRHNSPTIGVHAVTDETANADLLNLLMQDYQGHDLAIKCVLLDSGYHEVASMKELDRWGVPYVIRAANNKRVQKHIIEYARRKGPRIIPMTIRSGNQSVTVNLVITRKKRTKPGDPPHKRYVPFLVSGDPDKIKYLKISQLYAKRWPVENSYRSVKSIRPMTTSRNTAYRLFLFFMAVLLTMLCTLANFVAKRMLGIRDGKNFLTLRDMVWCLTHYLAQMILTHTGNNAERRRRMEERWRRRNADIQYT